MESTHGSGRQARQGKRSSRTRTLKRINLPFEKTHSLSKNQIEDLIVQQAHRIPMMEWEINLLIKSCKQNRCLHNGLAVVYEYACRLDEVKYFIDLRTKRANKLFSSQNDVGKMEIKTRLMKLASTNLSLLLALTYLRGLQWSPKSVLCANALDSKAGILAGEMASRLPIESSLKEEAKLVIKLYPDVLILEPHYVSAVLLAPTLDLPEIIPFLSHNIESADLTLLKNAVNAIRNMVSVEDDITTAYKVIRSSIKSKKDENPFNYFPTLRISYVNYTPPGTYSWFSRALSVYHASAEVLESVRERFKQTQDLKDSVLATNIFKENNETDFFDDAESIGALEAALTSGQLVVKGGPSPEEQSLPSFTEGSRSSTGKSVKDSSRPSSASAGLEEKHTARSRSSSGERPLSATARNQKMTSPVTTPILSAKRKSNSFTSAGKQSSPSPTTTSRKGSSGNVKPDRSHSFSGKSSSHSFNSIEAGSSTVTVIVENPDQIIQVTPSKTLMKKPPLSPIVTSELAVDFHDGTSLGKSAATPTKSRDISKRINQKSDARNLKKSKAQREKDFVDKKKEKNRNRKIQAKALSTSKSSDLLTYMNLTKSYGRAEARAESQVIQMALREVKVDGNNMVKLAARKICAWWHLVGPRRALKRRKEVSNICSSIIVDLINESALLASRKKRRIAQLLRHGSAITIQRMMKRWFYVKRRRLPPPGGWRSYSSNNRGLYLSEVSPSKTSRNIGSPISITRDPINSSFHGSPEKVVSKKKLNRWRAAVILQSMCRRVLAVRRVIVQRQLMKLKRKKMFTMGKVRAAVLIQTFFRGLMARFRLLKEIHAAHTVFKGYRRYRAMKRLRSDLRRVERPYRVTFRGIRNIPIVGITEESKVKIKISAYWSCLLHIFETLEERKTVIKGKKPQWVHSTQLGELRKRSAKTEERQTSSEKRETFGDRRGTFLGKIAGFVDPMSRGAKAKNVLLENEEDDAFVCYDVHLNDETIIIPALHGNSLLKLECFVDDVYVGETLFSLSEHGEMMFWGGDYALRLNFRNNIQPTNSPPTAMELAGIENTRRQGKLFMSADSTIDMRALTQDPPTLELQMDVGKPLLARCSYAKISVSSGPLRRAMRSTFGFLVVMVTNWKKVYMSFTGSEVYFYESKHASEPFYIMPSSDLIDVKVVTGKPTGDGFIFEDSHDVILRTKHNETISVRFMETSSRVHWADNLFLSINGYSDEDGKLGHIDSMSSNGSDPARGYANRSGNLNEKYAAWMTGSQLTENNTDNDDEKHSSFLPSVGLFGKGSAKKAVSRASKRRTSSVGTSLQAELLKQIQEEAAAREARGQDAYGFVPLADSVEYSDTDSGTDSDEDEK